MFLSNRSAENRTQSFYGDMMMTDDTNQLRFSSCGGGRVAGGGGGRMGGGGGGGGWEGAGAGGRCMNEAARRRPSQKTNGTQQTCKRMGDEPRSIQMNSSLCH